MSPLRLVLGCSIMFQCFILSPGSAEEQQTPPARPPMGWSSWNRFQDKIDDQLIRKQADALVASGMRDAGYIYVNIDDGWQGERDAAGVLHPNARFPDMKGLAAYLHDRGLKLGIYSTPSATSCAHYTGSMGHEIQDARTFAEWGVDLLKYDLCGFNDYAQHASRSEEEAATTAINAYRTMANALAATGRPIVFSVSQYGLDHVWRWASLIGANLWRTTGYIADNYDRMAQIGFGQAGLSPFAGPGHWNDPDMLEVGNGGMSVEEYRTHFTLWAVLAAPLIAGNDLTKIPPEARAILTQREVIAIDQDATGLQGERLFSEGSFEIWTKTLADGSKAVALFNRQESWMRGDQMSFELPRLGLGSEVRLRDIWAARELGCAVGTFKTWVPAHGTVLLRAWSAGDLSDPGHDCGKTQSKQGEQ